VLLFQRDSNQYLSIYRKIGGKAVFEHFSGKKVDTNDIDDRLDKTSKFSPEKQDLNSRDSGSEKKYEESLHHMQAVEYQMGLNEKNLNRLLTQALLLENGSLNEENPGIYRFDHIPPSWKKLVTTSLTDRKEYLHGALPKIVFDPKYFSVLENNRPIFRPKHDTVLLRLGHPIMQKAVNVLKRHLWDESNNIHRIHIYIKTTCKPENQSNCQSECRCDQTKFCSHSCVSL